MAILYIISLIIELTKVQKLSMGNINIDKNLFPLSAGIWEMSPRNPRLLIEKKTGTVAESNVVCITNRDILSNYEFRSLHKQFLVFILAILKEGAEIFCFTGSSKSSCFLEREKVLLAIEYIPYRLTDLGVLTYAEGAYTLFQCLNGLKLIMEKYGRVFISFEQEMVGVNQKGQCKIWADPNYFKCIQEGNSGLSQTEIIEILFSRIQDRMFAQMNSLAGEEYQKLKKSFFSQQKCRNSNITFTNALQFVETLCSINSFNLDKIRLKSFSGLTTNFNKQWMINNVKVKTSLKSQNKKIMQNNLTMSRKNLWFGESKKSQESYSSRASLSKIKQQLINSQIECPQKQSRCTMESQSLAKTYTSLYKNQSLTKKIVLKKIKL